MKTRIVLTTAMNRIIAIPVVNTPSPKIGDNTVVSDILITRVGSSFDYYLPFPNGSGLYYKATIVNEPLKGFLLRINIKNELRLSGFSEHKSDLILNSDDLGVPHAQSILESIMLPEKWYFGFKDYNYEYLSVADLGIKVRIVDIKELISTSTLNGTNLYKVKTKYKKTIVEGAIDFVKPEKMLKNVVTISDETNNKKEVAMDNAKNNFQIDGIDPKGFLLSLLPSNLMSGFDFENEWKTKIEPFIKESTAKLKDNAGKIVAGAALTALLIKIAEAYSDVLKFKVSRLSERKYNYRVLKKHGFTVDDLIIQNEESNIIREIGQSTALFGLEYNDVMFFKDSFKITSFNPVLTMGQVDKFTAIAEDAINKLIDNGYEELVKEIVRTGAKYENKLVDNGEKEGLLHNSIHYLSLGPVMPKCCITIIDIIYLRHAAKQI